MPSKNVRDIVLACENILGWTPSLASRMSLTKAREIEQKKLKVAMEKNPQATFRNLDLAIELSRRRAETRGPLQLLRMLREVEELAVEQNKPVGLGERIATAIAWEQEHQLPDARHWIGRLTRAQGPYRENALADWREARKENSDVPG